MFRVIGAVLLMLLICVFAGCAGHTTSLPASATPDSPAGQPAIDSPHGLPGLGGLAVPDHEVSLLGPGWFEIQPLNPYYKLQTRGATGLPGGALNVSGAGFTGWALYGVRGFDGDISPTSVMVDAASVTGEYYVAFSDYAENRWQFSGPFNGGAETQIPGMGSHASPLSFISSEQAFYFAIIVEDGNSLEISRLAVGIHGGGNAPEPPTGFSSMGGSTSLELAWSPSLSANDLDFAGYILERAPFLHGVFEPVSAEAITDTFFLDTNVEEDTWYRYRVAAVDVSGNMSTYNAGSGFFQTVPFSESAPVAIIDCPTGPFYGPAQIEVDLSRSFDPQGGAIDAYDLELSGGAVLSGAADTYSLTLQPGCYILTATVHVGISSGTAQRILKVLPAWEAEPVEIYSSFGDLPRMEFIRSVLTPDGNPLSIGYDPTIPSLTLWGRQGGEFFFRTFGGIHGISTAAPSFIGEPIEMDESFMVPVLMGNIISLISFNNETISLAGILPTSTSFGGQCAMYRIPDGPFGLVFTQENAGLYDLHNLVLGGGSPEVVHANVGVLTNLDAVWNPGTGAVDIVFADFFATQWTRFAPGAGVIANSMFAPIDSFAADIELDLTTGRPAVVHYYNALPATARYQLLNADNTSWGAVVEIDISDINTYPGDLVINSQGTFFLGGLANAGNPTFHLYELGAGVWSVRNTSTEELSDATNMNLLMDNVSGDAFATGYDKNGVTHIQNFNAGGTVSEEWTLDPGAGFGRELHGTSGSDGLHVIFSQPDTGLVSHMADTGSGWSHQGHPFGAVTDLDLASTSLGEVYSSFIDFNSAELHYWDGAAWILQENYPALEGYRPGLMDQPLQDVMNWAVYLQPANVFRYVNGSQAVPFTFSAVAPVTSPIWNCTVCSGDFFPTGQSRVLAIADNPSVVDADFGIFRHGTSSMDTLGTYLLFPGTPELWGRIMESCPYETLSRTTRAYWINYGSETGGNSLVYEDNGSGTNELEVPQSIPLSSLGGFDQDLRKTISMAYSHGGTAVALECDIPGKHPLFWWSNYGDWEDVPLPDGLAGGEGYMSMPELIVGNDGRWHIVYHNYLDDTIMVRSTV